MGEARRGTVSVEVWGGSSKAQMTCGDRRGVCLVDADVEPSSFERTMIPQNEVACDIDTAKKVLRLFDALDEHDDVQKVYHNGDLPPEAFEA